MQIRGPSYAFSCTDCIFVSDVFNSLLSPFVPLNPPVFVHMPVTQFNIREAVSYCFEVFLFDHNMKTVSLHIRLCHAGNP